MKVGVRVGAGLKYCAVACCSTSRGRYVHCTQQLPAGLQNKPSAVRALYTAGAQLAATLLFCPCRWLGDSRYTLRAVQEAFAARAYPIRVSYWPHDQLSPQVWQGHDAVILVRPLCMAWEQPFAGSRYARSVAQRDGTDVILALVLAWLENSFTLAA